MWELFSLCGVFIVPCKPSKFSSCVNAIKSRRIGFYSMWDRGWPDVDIRTAYLHHWKCYHAYSQVCVCIYCPEMVGSWIIFLYSHEKTWEGVTWINQREKKKKNQNLKEIGASFFPVQHRKNKVLPKKKKNFGPFLLHLKMITVIFSVFSLTNLFGTWSYRTERGTVILFCE